MAGKQTAKPGQKGPAAEIAQEDLDLLGPDLEDEGKDDAELWAEFDTDENGGKAAGADDPDAEDLRRAAAEEAAQFGDGEETPDDRSSAAPEGKRDDDAPAGKPDGDDTPPSGDKGKGQDEQDIWANATPDQRAAFEAAQEEVQRLQHAERSNRGRLSALQRQIDELNRSRGSSKAASEDAAGDRTGSGKGSDDQGADGTGFLESEDWKHFQEEYPEVAGPLTTAISSLQAEVTRQNKELSAIGNDRRQNALEEQADLLTEAHSDWRDVVADDGFEEWVALQPRHIREAAVRNAEEIVDAEEAADVVGRFKAFRDEQGAGDGSQQGQQPGAGDRQSAGSGNRQARRQRQLESASTTRSRGPGVASGIPEDGDPETIWRQFDQMESRQAGGA